jgi:hypothetical protein
VLDFVFGGDSGSIIDALCLHYRRGGLGLGPGAYRRFRVTSGSCWEFQFALLDPLPSATRSWSQFVHHCQT